MEAIPKMGQEQRGLARVSVPSAYADSGCLWSPVPSAHALG